MNKELEEAKVLLSNLKNTTNTQEYVNNFSTYDKAIETVLNLIQKQQEEIEKKDKIIDELEDKINLIETYYDISDLDKTIKEDA